MKLTFAERKFQRSHKKVEALDKSDCQVVMHGEMRRRCNVLVEGGRVYVRCAHTDKLLCNLSDTGYMLLLIKGYFSEW